jgi:hypothetical protein
MQKYTKEEVLSFITLLRKTFGRYEDHTGGCYKFYLLLKKVYKCDGFYNGNHVIVKIGHYFYDIDGEARFERDFYLIGGKNYPEEFMDKIFKEYI